MEIERLTQENLEEWDDFAKNSDTAWFRHTSAWQKYSMCCRFDSDSKNYSFFVKQNREIVATVPLITEYNYENRSEQRFAFYGDYTPLPAFKNDCGINKKALKTAINEEILRVARENNVTSGIFCIDPLIEKTYQNDFVLFDMMGDGGKLHVTTTNIADLRLEEDVLLREMRKGHKAAIKQALKKDGYRVDIFDDTNVTKEILLKFKEIHKIDAGRQTRTDESWDCMYEWILAKNAVLVMLYVDEIGDYCSGLFAITYKKGVYYGSFSTTDSKILNGLGGYIMQWRTILYLKAHGYETYDIGRNIYNTDNLKLKEIAKYKRGFRTGESLAVTYDFAYEDNK